MVYVLEVYSYESSKTHQMMFSENSIKLEKFVDLAREYHINWNYCEKTFREFCTGRCSSDWLDDFGSLFLNLSSNLGKSELQGFILMSAESLGHIFIFIGIISTWIFPSWLYFHWLRYDDKMLTDFFVVIAYSGIYFTLIAHYFKLTVSIYV